MAMRENRENRENTRSVSRLAAEVQSAQTPNGEKDGMDKLKFLPILIALLLQSTE